MSFLDELHREAMIIHAAGMLIVAAVILAAALSVEAALEARRKRNAWWRKKDR